MSFNILVVWENRSLWYITYTSIKKVIEYSSVNKLTAEIIKKYDHLLFITLEKYISE